MIHICTQIYTIGANNKIYGVEKGICRVTGKESMGILFDKWVKNTFNDHDYLFPGTIISNAALFCFDENSEIIQKKIGCDKHQRFRTYSHIIKDDVWYCLTKAKKRLIFQLIIDGAEMVCLTNTGQKHILFKHKKGMWQLDELYVPPNIPLLKLLHFHMCELMSYEFSQTEIVTGKYNLIRIMNAGLKNWQNHENIIKEYRGMKIFDFTSFMLFTDKKILDAITEENTKKLETKSNNMVNNQCSLF